MLRYLFLLLFFIPVVLHAQNSTNTQLQEYKDMLDKGQITSAEYDVLVKKAKHPHLGRSGSGYGSGTGGGTIMEVGALVNTQNSRRSLFAFNAVFGGRPIPNLFIGGGPGINIGTYRYATYYTRRAFLLLDALADLHYFVLQTRVSPFIGFQAGPTYYNYEHRGGVALNIHPSIGVRGYLKKTSLGCSLGYRYNRFYGTYAPLRNVHFLSINFTVIFG